jgi:hypothetical protein
VDQCWPRHDGQIIAADVCRYQLAEAGKCNTSDKRGPDEQAWLTPREPPQRSGVPKPGIWGSRSPSMKVLEACRYAGLEDGLAGTSATTLRFEDYG